MKARALILAASFLFAEGFLFAQENETKERIRYSNITEFGFITASPQGISLEATTVHGFSIEKQHFFGLGMGFGVNFHNQGRYYRTNDAMIYMPVFFNYRLCFKPNKTFSPHVNIAIGGIAVEDGAGVYSVFTMGFKARAFSFSSGFSFMPFRITYKSSGYFVDDDSFSEWYSPFGVALKFGFSF